MLVVRVVDCTVIVVIAVVLEMGGPFRPVSRDFFVAFFSLTVFTIPAFRFRSASVKSCVMLIFLDSLAAGIDSVSFGPWSYSTIADI